jgi:hypothetical protein
VAGPKHAHVFGFWRGLRGGWDAFTRTASATATAFGAVLPFLVLLAVLALAFVLGRRRLHARHPDDQPPRPQES